MVHKALFSSKQKDWETPASVFDPLNKEFKFTLDVCASANNRKCDNWFSVVENGLLHSWKGNTCWMNPPYGRRETGMWVKKAHWEFIENRVTTVALLPARTDTKWFHQYIYQDPTFQMAEIRFIKGRIKFVGAKHAAPFPSMIVIWR